MPPLSYPAARPALRWLAVAVGYFVAARISAQAGTVRDGVPLVLFALGIAYASVQLWGPWLATAVAAGAIGEALYEGLPAGSVLLLGAAAAGAGLTAFVVTRFFHTRGERLTDTLIRTGAALAAGIVAASFMLAANLVDNMSGQSVSDWALLIVVNTAGIIVVAPFVRAWVQRVAHGLARWPSGACSSWARWCRPVAAWPCTIRRSRRRCSCTPRRPARRCGVVSTPFT